MKQKRIAALAVLSVISLLSSAAVAAESVNPPPSDEVYTASNAAGEKIFTAASTLNVGDEYISADNMLYRISSVNGYAAVAEQIGPEIMPDVSWLDAGQAQAVFASSDSGESDGKGERRLIAMYVTHSDESYIPSDGTQSIEGQGGIYDVARDFRDALQKEGIDVILDESTHLPHDAGAYRRSRQTAERLLQKRPDAIIDIHRDGIPDQSEYTCSINGENASQVRLLVGRSNQNSQANREFAKQIKAVADKQYPGLIKDIFIGKGSYNQDLAPNAILLEFGTHTISKERVLNSTDAMAEVVRTTLYGKQTGSASAGAKESGRSDKGAPSTQDTRKKAGGRGALSGIFLIAGIAIAGVIVFSFLQTGSGKGMKTKISRGMRELTGGMLGKKPEKKDP